MGGLCSKASVQKKLIEKGGFRSAFDSNSETWNPVEKKFKEKQEPDHQNHNHHHHHQQQQQQQDQEKQQQKSIQYPQDDFYDGIPRYIEKQQALSSESRSIRSTQAAIAKVSEVSLRLGRAGTIGFGKAVDVLDILGSSMTNLNSSGFVSGGAIKGSEISILAFEVANTIVKGFNLLQSLSKRNIKHLKEVVLPSEGVQQLVSNDTDILLRIVAVDKREDLKIFCGEVVRFGNHCKDPQWHNLDRYFEKVCRELTPQKVMEEADVLMQQLMTLVHFTAELYHEMHALDRLELDYQRRYQDEGDNLAMRSELKNQKKIVRALKKKSLWSRSLEEVVHVKLNFFYFDPQINRDLESHLFSNRVTILQKSKIMGKLVDIVQFMHLEIRSIFNDDGVNSTADEFLLNHQRLGPAGLALHYANIVNLIDTLVARSSSMPPNSKDSLYQSLPPSLKIAMRSKLPLFHVEEELTVVDIKAEMEKTLQWLVPTATNTVKAHHGFGWVGEWAHTGSDAGNPETSVQTAMLRIETLHHADKEKTEEYILELLLWLQHLANKNQCDRNDSYINKSIVKFRTCARENQPSTERSTDA